MAVRAIWHGAVLAEADHTVVVGGHRYFPPESVRWECLLESPTSSWCYWKGRARYLSVAIDDEVVPDAAWYYPKPWPLAKRIADHVAFQPGVRVDVDQVDQEAIVSAFR